MTIRRAIVAAVLLVLLIALGRSVSRFIPVLQRNRAVYALNQGNYVEAQHRLEKVLSKTPGEMESLLRLAESRMRQGYFKDAVSLLNGTQGTSLSQRDYLAALASYETGDEDRVHVLLEQLDTPQSLAQLGTNERQMHKLAIAALSETKDEGNRLAASEAPKAAMERMLWHSWLGRIEMHGGRWHAAATQFQQALRFGDQNPRTAVLAASASALDSDFSTAQYYVDSQSSPTRAIQDLRQVALKAINDQKSSSVAMQGFAQQIALSQAEGRLASWTQLQEARRGSVGEPVATTTSDPLQQMLKGDLLMLQERYPEAYGAYTSAGSAAPSLPIILRKLDVSGERFAPMLPVQEFAESLPESVFIAASECTTTARLTPDGVAQFRTPGQLRGAFHLPKDGIYHVVIVANADHAKFLGPLIRVQIDTFSPHRLYIAREAWDCYAFDAELSAGRHEIKLEYSSEADAVSGTGENRSLYILGILIHRAPEA